MDYVTRDEWGARPAKAKVILAPANIQGIFVHHSVTPTGPDEAKIVRAIQAFHMDSKGWNDIAYSWLVGQSGRIYEGRGWLVNGGHTEGWNFTSHAVCFIGNSDQDVPSDAALRSINEVIAESQRRFGGFVQRHGAVNQTGCPGANLSKWVDAGRPVAAPPAPEPAIQVRKLMDGSLNPVTGRVEMAEIRDGKVFLSWQGSPNGGWNGPAPLHTPGDDPGAFDTVTLYFNADGRGEIVAAHSAYGVKFRKVQSKPGATWGKWVQV